MKENVNLNERQCGICGDQHMYSQCTTVQIIKKVCDKSVPSKARLTLPDVVNIETMADGSHAIVANTQIEKGTQFGPLEAQKLLTLEPSIVFPIKLFNNNVEDLSEYYLNTSDEHFCNWLMFVMPAQCLDEQNLVCFQDASQILYVSIKDISPGEHLKVWYSAHYAKQMQKELLAELPLEDVDVNTTMAEPIDLNNLLKKQQKISNRENWICKFCGKLEKDVTLFANHIIEHYSKKITKDCDICDKSFSTLKDLRRHIKQEHNKPVIAAVPTNIPVSINRKTKDSVVGGPLLNDLLTDSLDNTNLVMPNIELNMNVLENDALNLAVDNLLTENVKELDHFNFEIAETQEQYVCDICLKVFSKLYYLIQHLKKHTGRYTCGHCLKIFSRRENLNSHRCSNNNNNNDRAEYKCSFCDKSFTLKKHLQRHIYLVHEKRYSCDKCNKICNSNKEFIEHYCATNSTEQIPVFPCTLCNKKFQRDSYLRRHLNRHSKNVQPVKSADLICEMCGVRCKSLSGMYLHKKNHGERSLECSICNKKFYRKCILDEHLLTHCDSVVKCGECNKLCKNEKTLSVHMRQHKALKLHKCNQCVRTFTQVANLNAHVTKIHLKQCKICSKSFPTIDLLEVHLKVHTLKEYFSCPVCTKVVKLKSSLKRHIKQNHADQNLHDLMSTVKVMIANVESYDNSNIDEINSDNATLEQLCNTDGSISQLRNELSENDSNNFDSIVDNFETIINSYRNEELLNTTPTKTDKIEKRLLDFTDLQMDMDNSFDIQRTIGANNHEVCLSMPDLAESDQEIMLGDNAYILDNGTIVEPKDQGNVLVYVLDENL